MIPEQSTQKSQAAVADDIARANAPIEKVRSFLFGHDIFISYARADALDYAPRLANQLTKLGFRCYLDQLDAPVGVKTPGAVMRALRRSTGLVDDYRFARQQLRHDGVQFRGRRRGYFLRWAFEAAGSTYGGHYTSNRFAHRQGNSRDTRLKSSCRRVQS